MSCSIRVPTYLHTESDTERGLGVREGCGDGGGGRGGSSSGMLPTGEAGQQRKQEKYIFLSRRSPSKAPHTSSILRCAALLFSSSSSAAAPASHFVLLSPGPLIPPLVLPHTHSLIPNLFFPLYWTFFNCSRRTSLLHASSLSSSLSITSEHATSHCNPFTHSR